MVTSAVPGEGKSTVASNLAHSLSKLENTVLIEADMRRPGLGRALNLRSHGLSNVLNGEIYLEDALRENAIGDLDLIPAGKIPENHLELLASPEFAEVLELLHSRYDRIVIDMAPVQAVSDAIVVGKYVDSTIYVVKADGTPLPVVKRGVERLKEKGIAVSGVVISQVDLARISSYGGDYYYQGYYDYYGYGEDIGKKPEGPSISQNPDRFYDNGPEAQRPIRRSSRVSGLKDRRDRTDPTIVEDIRA
jgi:capsular exopolysaccharide synthesis family protein